jgi:hypothetical protein
MKKLFALFTFSIILLMLMTFTGYCQTLFVPSGTGGIGASSITGSIGIGTSSPRGQFDVAGTGDIYLSNNPITGTGQSIYLPGHIFMAPYGGSDWTYLQARRPDNSGSTNLTLRTWNAGAMTQAMTIRSNGDVGIGTITPQAKMHILDGQVMSSDLNYNNINVRLDGRSIPVINFTRWIGSASIQHNAFVGQFFNTSAGGEYSFGIGTGYSATGDQTANINALTILLNGNTGIGTTIPDAKLAVKGTIHSNEVKVDLNVQGPDYVFEPTYHLKPLAEIETYIKENKHLPEVPTAKEMEKNGVLLGEMNMLLLKKVEELTLYVIEQQRKLNEQTKKSEAQMKILLEKIEILNAKR